MKKDCERLLFIHAEIVGLIDIKFGTNIYGTGLTHTLFNYQIVKPRVYLVK